MTVRELAMANAMRTQDMYVVCNGETIAAFCQKYIDSIRGGILDAEVESYHAMKFADDVHLCIFINEVIQSGAG